MSSTEDRLEAEATRLLLEAGQDPAHPALSPDQLRRRKRREVLMGDVPPEWFLEGGVFGTW